MTVHGRPSFASWQESRGIPRWDFRQMPAVFHETVTNIKSMIEMAAESIKTMGDHLAPIREAVTNFNNTYSQEETQCQTK